MSEYYTICIVFYCKNVYVGVFFRIWGWHQPQGVLAKSLPSCTRNKRISKLPAFQKYFLLQVNPRKMTTESPNRISVGESCHSIWRLWVWFERSTILTEFFHWFCSATPAKYRYGTSNIYPGRHLFEPFSLPYPDMSLSISPE